MTLDWILNAYGIDLRAYVVLWIALLVVFPIVVVVGIIKAVAGHREKRRREP